MSLGCLFDKKTAKFEKTFRHFDYLVDFFAKKRRIK